MGGNWRWYGSCDGHDILELLVRSREAGTRGLGLEHSGQAEPPARGATFDTSESGLAPKPKAVALSCTVLSTFPAWWGMQNNRAINIMAVYYEGRIGDVRSWDEASECLKVHFAYTDLEPYPRKEKFLYILLSCQ